MDSGEGVPSKSVMRSNWCTTFFPGNSGFPVSISANMHPILQISIAGVYWKIKFKSNYYNLYHPKRIREKHIIKNEQQSAFSITKPENPDQRIITTKEKNNNKIK